MPPSAPNKQKDPVQTGLRNHKRQWNATYKDVSQKLKAFKNGLNGKGDAKFSVPPSDIKSPFPTEIGSFLDGLAGEFQSLLADAHTIIQEQDRYSKTRRKRKPKGAQPPKAPEQAAPPAPPQPGAATEPNAVVDTLSRLGANYDDMLEVYSSNKLTRLWQYMGPPFRRKQFNKQRLALLSLSADLYYSIMDFENEILSLKLNSIPKSLSKYQASRSTFDAIKATIEKLADMVEKNKDKIEQKTKEVPKSPVSPGPRAVEEKHRNDEGFVPGKPVSPKTMDEEIKKIYSNIQLLGEAGFTRQAFLPILVLIGDFRKEEDPSVKAMLRDRAREAYNDFMKSIVNEAQKKYGPATINSPQDLINLIRKNRNEPDPEEHKEAQFNPQLTKSAHNRLTRFLKRQLVKARSYNSTAGSRLEIAESVDEVKKLLQQMMNALEEQLDPEALIGFLETLNENMQSINKTLAVLITLYEQEFYKNERKKPGKLNKIKKDKNDPEGADLDQFTDYLMRRKVRRDMSKGIM